MSDGVARLSAAGGGVAEESSLFGLVADGTAAVAVGTAVAGGFGVEAAKALVTGEHKGLGWFIGFAVAGVVVVLLGFALRARSRRRVRVGIVVSAMDPRRSEARAVQLDQEAQDFSQAAFSVTLRAAVRLAPGERWEVGQVDALAEEVLTATALAARLTPDAARVCVVPTLPLHVAFRLGAQLGHTHSRLTMVFALKQGKGGPTYFPAVALRAVETKAEPLVVDEVRVLGHGSAIALAVDLQGRGAEFLDPVLHACRVRGVGHLLVVRTTAERLPETTAAFTAAVEQTCRAWRSAALPARTARRVVFLSGPTSIALALGARLAGPDVARWTACTFDRDTGEYESLPPSG
ncbi:SAVED domain-containing protein [Actinokineospora sp. G85]|uniref:SAVED domain-containing protein n=1 Tax=Actinokineospora sp. G85 TaxID=3406626 RepID=UPI003C73327D